MSTAFSFPSTGHFCMQKSFTANQSGLLNFFECKNGQSYVLIKFNECLRLSCCCWAFGPWTWLVVTIHIDEIHFTLIKNERFLGDAKHPRMILDFGLKFWINFEKNSIITFPTYSNPGIRLLVAQPNSSIKRCWESTVLMKQLVTTKHWSSWTPLHCHSCRTGAPIRTDLTIFPVSSCKITYEHLKWIKNKNNWVEKIAIYWNLSKVCLKWGIKFVKFEC